MKNVCFYARKIRKNFHPAVEHTKKHMAYCKKYKTCILK